MGSNMANGNEENNVYGGVQFGETKSTENGNGSHGWDLNNSGNGPWEENKQGNNTWNGNNEGNNTWSENNEGNNTWNGNNQGNNTWEKSNKKTNSANAKNLPVKQGFWTKFKSFWFQEIDWNKEIKVELTPYQQKVEDEINEFLHQEITWEKVHNFLFQEITFGKKKTEV